MARWDHADLMSVDSKALCYPEYCDLESLKRYNPEYLQTEEGMRRFPQYTTRMNQLAAMPDSEIDTSDIPEVTDWSGAERGKFVPRYVGQEKWDRDYLDLAEFWAKKRSKDPSTKCGAVIVRPDNTIASLGYNGFPRGIEDKPELYENREEKYRRVVHCEMNAILNAREPLKGYTLYTFPFLTCDRCCVHVIQAGIIRVVSLKTDNERWKDSFDLAMELYKEAGVEVMIYESV